jgi:hypothetical protein
LLARKKWGRGQSEVAVVKPKEEQVSEGNQREERCRQNLNILSWRLKISPILPDSPCLPRDKEDAEEDLND